MSPLATVDAAVERVKARGFSLTLMQCTSAYPCPPEQVGLNLIPFFRERYGCSVGLSDHSGSIYAGLAARVLGIQALEIHVTLSREMFGPDVPASVTTRELQQLVDGIRFIERMQNNPSDKDTRAEKTKPLRTLFMQSIVLTTKLPAGTILKREHLDWRKPGTGRSPWRLRDLLGGRLTRDVRAMEFLEEQDVEVRK